MFRKRVLPPETAAWFVAGATPCSQSVSESARQSRDRSCPRHLTALAVNNCKIDLEQTRYTPAAPPQPRREVCYSDAACVHCASQPIPLYTLQHPSSYLHGWWPIQTHGLSINKLQKKTTKYLSQYMLSALPMTFHGHTIPPHATHSPHLPLQRRD